MKKFFLTFLFLITATFSTIHAASEDIFYNNRPLAKINNKTISLLDVIKQMDLFLYENAPEVFNHEQQKHQFYQSNWRKTLKDLVENELMVIDAKDKEFIEVSEGDVREEIFERFGPNVMSKLACINLTLAEAKEMMETELTVRQVIWFRAYNKALQSVTPEAIRIAYKAYLKQHPPKDEWIYQVLSVKGDDKQKIMQIAEQAYEALQTSPDLNQISEKLLQEESDNGVTITASKDFLVSDKNLSSAHRKVLTNLGLNTFSKPVEQNSRTSQKVVRIFYLKSHHKEDPVTFESVAERLKNTLTSKAAELAKKQYLEKLQQRLHYKDEDIYTIPDRYEPFLFKQY